MATSLTTDSSILVVRAGTWGVSYPYPVPSPICARNDVNKILELGSFAGDGSERWVSKKSLEAATDGWLNDPLFKPCLHKTGCMIAATSEEGRGHMNTVNGPNEASGWRRLRTKEDFQATMPKCVLTGEFPGWEGWSMEKKAGWVHARKAMEIAAKEAERLGAVYITGEMTGKVGILIYEDGDIKGAKTLDGVEHRADRTVLCAGASAGAISDMKYQLRPTV